MYNAIIYRKKLYCRNCTPEKQKVVKPKVEKKVEPPKRKRVRKKKKE